MPLCCYAFVPCVRKRKACQSGSNLAFCQRSNQISVPLCHCASVPCPRLRIGSKHLYIHTSLVLHIFVPSLLPPLVFTALCDVTSMSWHASVDSCRVHTYTHTYIHTYVHRFFQGTRKLNKFVEANPSVFQGTRNCQVELVSWGVRLCS